MISGAGQAGDPAGLAEGIAALYSLMPAEFTAARNARAAEAVSAGNRELAARLKKLPKPSSAAWLINMVRYNRTDLLHEVLDLGAALREAQDDLDQKELRRLSTERQRLLRAITRDARTLARELGNPVSPAVAAEAEQTLWAAMTDPNAADAVASGQLIRSLEANGWEPVDLQGAVAAAEVNAPGTLPVSGSARRSAGANTGAGGGKEDPPDGEEIRRQRAEAAREARKARSDLRRAQAQAESAETELETLQQKVDDEVSRRAGLTDEIEELRGRIRDLEREVSAVDRRAGALEQDRDGARRTVRAARRAVEKARDRLDRLS